MEWAIFCGGNVPAQARGLGKEEEEVGRAGIKPAPV